MKFKIHDYPLNKMAVPYKVLLVIAFPKINTTVTFIITIVTVQDFIFFQTVQNL